jgi:phosphoglycerate kinase
MNMTKKTIRDIEIAGKTVLLRTSLNVPIADGKVGDKLRIKSAVPTIRYLLDQGAKVVLISHHSSQGTSLAPVAPVLSELLHQDVAFLPDCIGAEVEQAVKALRSGQVLLLENLRFHAEEEANDAGFARALAGLAEVYVDDDFTATHREHASMVGVPKILPAVAGFQIEKEVTQLTEAMEYPKPPLVVVVGGAKISTKIAFIENFLDKAKAILVGGAMANTFLKAAGHEVGRSLVEDGELDTARGLVAKARSQGVQLLVPIDVVVTDNLEGAGNVRTVMVAEVGPSDVIADVGPQTVGQLDELLAKQGTVIWNGPLGITEKPAFAAGSRLLAGKLIASGVTSIVGGGDTAAFVDEAGLHDKFSFVSTGGGASLELMSGKTLPAIEVLLDK